MNIQDHIAKELNNASEKWSRRTTVQSLELDVKKLAQTLDELKALIKSNPRFSSHRYQMLASIGIIEGALAETE